MVKPALNVQSAQNQVFDVHFDEIDSARLVGGRTGEKVPQGKILSPEVELSRVDSPQDYSNFVGTQFEEREDTHALLT